MNILKLYELLEAIIKEIEYQHKEDSDCIILNSLLEKAFAEDQSENNE